LSASGFFGKKLGRILEFRNVGRTLGIAANRWLGEGYERATSGDYWDGED
jgi:hypothetical protein